VPASLTYVPATITSLHSGRNSVRSLAIAQIIKAIKCLDIATGRVYVSHDVEFDEAISHSLLFIPMQVHIYAMRFPFFHHPPLASMSYGDRSLDIGHVPKSTNALLQSCTLQDSSQVDRVEDRSILLHGAPCFPETAVE
jgi:hypothetical protein